MSESYSEILERMKAKYAEYAGYSPDDASDIGIRMKTLAGEIFSLTSSMDFIKRQMFPTTATGKYLDMHAEMRALKRIDAVKASGQLMFYTERALSYDFTVPAGTVCAVSDGSLRYVTDKDAVLTAGSAFVLIPSHAENGGSRYNIPTNTVNAIVTYFSESIYVNNTVGFGGGADAESDDALRKRIAESYYNPPNGINETYYKELALSVEGVYSASVRPLAHGTGTVGVYVASRGAKTSPAVVSEVQELMDKYHPMNTNIYVSNAELSTVPIKLTVSASGGYYPNDVKANVENAVKEYFKVLKVGEALKLCNIGEAVYHVPGVDGYSFDTTVTSEKSAEANTLYTLGALTVTIS